MSKYHIDDPIAYEIFKHRLWSINERSHAILGNVSGSPVVIDGHEYLCGIHKANGDAVLINSGVLYHVIGMEMAIKHLVNFSEEEHFPIEDGDQFLNNDPYIASMHTLDMGIVKPVFYEGQIVAWLTSLFHTPAVPCAMVAGAYSPGAQEVYQEGLRAQGLKIVSRGEVCADVLRNLMANARDPDMLGLDHVSKIAANNVASDEILKLIAQFGIAYVEKAFDRVIDESEARCREKIRELPDGEWTTVLYLDTTGIEIKPRKVQAKVLKQGERLRFDYEGTAPQEPGSIQCAFPAGLAHIFVVLASQLFWDVPWNTGILRAIEYNLPQGSLVNVDFPHAVSHSVITIVIQNAAHRCVAHMQFPNGKLREDVNAGWAGGGSPKFSGTDQRGRPFATTLMTAFAAGNGARCDMDGVNSGGLMLTPESEISNVETHEMFYPLLYLWRREAPESYGPGKFRGGVGLDQAFVPHNAPEGYVTATGIPIGDHFTFIHGLFGGYPGGLRGVYRIERSNIGDLFSRGEVPMSLDEFQGEVTFVPATVGSFDVRTGDVVQYLVAGGGGYGDPLERDPLLVLKDFQDGYVTPSTAEKIHGVVLDENRSQVDRHATASAREAIMLERLREGAPLKRRSAARQWSPQDLSSENITTSQITDHLWLAEHRGSRYCVCGRCGFELCEDSENYKLYALIRERTPREIGLPDAWHPKENSGMVYREFYCPGCGRMLDVEPTIAGAPLVHDMRMSI